MRASSSSAALLVSLAGTVVAQQTCYSGVNVFAARGTGEQPPTGLGLSGVHINAILAAVPGSNATAIDYPASFTNNSVPTGVQNGTNQITSYLDACPTSKIVVMGYSQGADVMGYVLTGANFTINPQGQAENYTVPPLAAKYADQVAAVVFFGDPQFNINIGINSDAPYPCNVSSADPRTGDVWDSYGSRLEEWCNYSDFACCGTGTTFAGHISYFSQENGTITGDFVAGKLGISVSSSTSSTSTPVTPTVTPLSTISIASASKVSASASKLSSAASVKSSSVVKPSSAAKSSSVAKPSSSVSAKVSSAAKSSAKSSSAVSSLKASVSSASSAVSSSAVKPSSSHPTASKSGFEIPTELPPFAFPTFTMPFPAPTAHHWPRDGANELQSIPHPSTGISVGPTVSKPSAASKASGISKASSYSKASGSGYGTVSRYSSGTGVASMKPTSTSYAPIAPVSNNAAAFANPIANAARWVLNMLL